MTYKLGVKKCSNPPLHIHAHHTRKISKFLEFKKTHRSFNITTLKTHISFNPTYLKNKKSLGKTPKTFSTDKAFKELSVKFLPS